MSTIKVHLQEVGWGGMDWFYLAQDSDTCKCGNELLGSIKWGKVLVQLRSSLLHKDYAPWSE